MRVLLDTCILSELRREPEFSSLTKIIASLPDESLYMSVITLGEITKGIALLPESRRKSDLAAWLMATQNSYADRVLPIDPETAAIWGEITAKAHLKGSVVPAADGLIAATALRHGLHLMTRNIKDFAETGVLLWNPWQTDE